MNGYVVPNRIRLSSPKKTIWLYTGYRVKEIYKGHFILSPSAVENLIKLPDYKTIIESGNDEKRSNIIKQCSVLVDGKYIDELKDISLAWCGSSNQKVTDIQKSLQKGEIVLWQT